MLLKLYFKETLGHYSNTSEAIILSGEEQEKFANKVYVIIEDSSSNEELFNLQINCEFYCSTFRGLTQWNDFIAIGFDDYFYLFNYKTKALKTHKLNSYFDSFYKARTKLFICSMSNINCFSNEAEFLWRSPKLGLSSVKIAKIANNRLLGTGDWGDAKGMIDFDFDLCEAQLIYDQSNKSKKGILKSILQNFKKKKA